MGIGAVKAGLRTADHFDALDVLNGEVGEIEVADADGIDRHAVDQHLEMIGLGAAHAHLREGAAPAALAHRHAGNGTQRVGDGGEAFLAQFFAGDDRGGGAHLGRIGRRLIGVNHDAGNFRLRLRDTTGQTGSKQSERRRPG